MDLQYLSDEAGNHTAVVVPIKEWEALTEEIDHLKKVDHKLRSEKHSDFIGLLPAEIADAMQAYVKESRQIGDSGLLA